MNAANRVLVFSLCLLIAAVVFVAARYVLVLSTEIPMATDVPGIENEIGSEPTTSRGRNPEISAHVLSRAQGQTVQLQEALDQARQLIANRTDSLRKKDAECAALQKELDASIAFYFSTLEGTELPQPGLVADLTKQLQAIQGELRETAEVRLQQISELEQLRAELLESELRSAEIRVAATDEITALLAEQEALAAASRNALLLVQDDVVPILIELLAEPNPAVRSWATSALTQLGIEAAPAVSALRELLGDDDERVRRGARLALAAIGG